jgi:prolipoprotein diacylglyceryl transferase
VLLRSFPSPTRSNFEIGPLTFHYYALCIIAGIAIAVWLGNRRFSAHDAKLSGVVGDVAIVAVPSGIIGGRLYHVLSSPEKYFGDGANPVDAFKIWEGGLGIWGAISLGVAGALLTYRSLSRKADFEYPPFPIFLDALAPGVLLAQALGRLGNWFNKELFGKPLESWWALEIPVSYRPRGYETFESFHPTFAYEAIWCTLIAIALLSIKKMLAPGAIFSMYIALYCVGRFFIESLRIDDAELIAGIRLNQWVSLMIGSVAFAIFTRIQRRASTL